MRIGAEKPRETERACARENNRQIQGGERVVLMRARAGEGKGARATVSVRERKRERERERTISVCMVIYIC